MDEDEFLGHGAAGWSRKCLCGKQFFQVNSYTNHINSCKVYRRSVGSTLESAKSRYRERQSKKGKEKQVSSDWFDNDDLGVDYVLPPAGPSARQTSRETTPPYPMGSDSGVPEEYPILSQEAAPQDNIQDAPMEVEDQPAPAEYGRSHRVRNPVQRFKDFAATSTIPFEIPSLPMEEEDEAGPGNGSGGSPSQPTVVEECEPSPSEVLRRTVHDDRCWKTTPVNRFGLYKKYWTLESRPHDPDFFITGDDLREDEETDTAADDEDKSKSHTPSNRSLFPFPNWSSFSLGEWYWDDRREKGRESFRQLINIVTSDAFDKEDVRAANWDKIGELLGASEFDQGTAHDFDFDWFGDGTSWQTATIQLEVPFNRTSLEPGVHHYEVPNFRYRPLMPIIIERLKDAARGDHFHVTPSDLRWRPSGDEGPDIRVYGEMYNSPAFLNAYREVQALPPEPTESSLPRCIIVLIFASDETMLASFGTSKLWPVYMMFGNESKYRRGKSSLKLFEEVAYFQSVPDEFQDWYISRSGKKAVSQPLSTHLNREIFHAQWRILLDDDFVAAYAQGIIVDCFDGVRRRFYPRILAYAADYPERVTIVGIRNMGDHPCPRCLVPLSEIHHMGKPEDLTMRTESCRKDDEERKKKTRDARNIIHKKNYSVNTAEVEKLLKPTSLVPAMNAFSERLSSYGLDVFGLISVDILHEVEIGSWKSLFIQLLRLLEAVDKGYRNVLDARYRQMPTFGRDTIRRFKSNTSEMKQLAARDYEDILQCAIPAFEGLLPGVHGDRVQNLIFIFAHWHSLAKLKLHTDETLNLLDEWTVLLGNESRLFVEETCNTFETRELKREYEARKRGEARRQSKSTKTGGGPASEAHVQGLEAVEEVPQQEPSAQKAPGTAKAKGGKAKASISKRGSSISAATRLKGTKPRKTVASKPATRDGQSVSTAPVNPAGPGLITLLQGPTPLAADPTPGPSSPTAETTTVGELAVLPSSTGSGAGSQSLQSAGVTNTETAATESGADSRRVKTWSLSTSKFHAMGDVAAYIRAFGTTDSYSTQLSERFHRFPKARFRRTNKKQTAYQLSRIQTRQARIKKLRKQLSPPSDEGPTLDDGDDSPPPYFIGKSQNKPVQMSHFLRVNSSDRDPATKGFLSKLRHHLLPRIIERLLQEAKQSPEDYTIALPLLEEAHRTSQFSDAHLNGVYFHADRFYRHSVFQTGYTTYDCRRAHDTLNPTTTRRDIICLRTQAEPLTDQRRYIYGRILAVFHVNVIYGGPGILDHRPRRYDILWVRWFDSVDGRVSEDALWSCKRLDRISLRPLSSPDACGFVDPSDVLRAAHIIPRFFTGKVYNEVTDSNRIYSKCAQDRDDWKEYYVNPFVDRDMMMRFHWGMGVGHVHANASSRRHQPVSVGIQAVPNAQQPEIDGGRAELAPGPMDVDPSSDSAARNAAVSSAIGGGTDSEDSAYDRPQGSDIALDDEADSVGSDSGLPDVQEPESSDQGDEVYL